MAAPGKLHRGKYICKRCGKTVSVPGRDGMTTKDLQSAIVDVRGGMCTDCFIKHRSEK